MEQNWAGEYLPGNGDYLQEYSALEEPTVTLQDWIDNLDPTLGGGEDWEFDTDGPGWDDFNKQLEGEVVQQPSQASNHGGHRLRPEPLGDYQALITDEAAYNLAKYERHNRERLFLAVSMDQQSGYPQDLASQRVYIQRLYDAIRDTSEIIDKPCKNGRPAQAAQRMDAGYWPAKVIEIACWSILTACRDSQLGVRLVDPHHGIRREGNDVHSTFDARMDEIIRACKQSKALCKQVLDPLYIHRLVDAPRAELQMKENNKKINAERDIQNEIGRRAVKKGLKPEHIDELDLPNPEAGAKSQPITKLQRTPTGPESKPVAASPPRTASRPICSVKRKQRITWKTPIPQDDEHSSNGELTACFPSGHPTRRRRPATETCRRQRLAQGESDDEYVPTESVKDNTSIRRRSARRTSAQQHLSTHSMSGSPFQGDNPVPSQEMLKEVICDILQVDRSMVQEYSLEDLRIYARAYNIAYDHDNWYHPELPSYYGRQYRIYMGQIQTAEHFAQMLPVFRRLALVRGDLLPNLRLNSQSSHSLGFSTNGDVLQDQALGVIQNPYGLHLQLHN